MRHAIPTNDHISWRMKYVKGDAPASYAETHEEERIMMSPPPRSNAVVPITSAALVVRLSDRNDGAQVRCGGCGLGQIQTFVAPAGDQHDVVHPFERGQRRVRVGRLRVVHVRDPLDNGDLLDPMAAGFERSEHRAG